MIWRKNFIYSAIDTALAFATHNGAHPGALFYLWVVVGNDRAVSVESVAEPVRDLNIYQRWSRFQPEGEITAKIHIPANQIEKVQWWNIAQDKKAPRFEYYNVDYVDPVPLNLRKFF